jgi:hypothetical protein
LTKITLDPGDLILFSGQTAKHLTVQQLTQSRWSQVGLIVSLPNYDEPMLLEATSIPLSADVETGSFAPGVRTTRLEARLCCFEGVAAARKLRPLLDPLSRHKLTAFRRYILDRPFNFSFLESRRSLRRTHREWDGKSFICSTLVAAAYQSVGVMKEPPQGRFRTTYYLVISRRVVLEH